METTKKKIVFFPRTFDWIIFKDGEAESKDVEITPCITFMDTEQALKRKEDIIYTTSLSHLSLNIEGYDTYIANKGKLIHIYEGLKIPNGCELTKYHDLIEMIKINYFNNL